MRTLAAWLLIALVGFGTIALIAAIMALPVMWLWNYAAVDVLGVAKLDFWHALCLNLLCGILIRGGGAPAASKKAD